MGKIYIPEIPFYQMNLNELRAFFIKINRKLERKRKTKRRFRGRRKKTVKK